MIVMVLGHGGKNELPYRPDVGPGNVEALLVDMAARKEQKAVSAEQTATPEAEKQYNSYVWKEREIWGISKALKNRSNLDPLGRNLKRKYVDEELEDLGERQDRARNKEKADRN